MLRVALRSSSTQLGSKRALAALSSLLHHPAPAPLPDLVSGYRHAKTTQFHSKPNSLEFRSTLATRAGSAAEDTWFDDEKATPASKGAEDESLEIAKLGISQEIVTALAGRGIHKLFPIQRAVLEPAMAGHDMYGRARTGTGKTLAFGIPILNKITQYNQKHGRGKYPLALVLAPTRELARQVEKEFTESAGNLDIICVYGGTPIAKQMKELEYGVDVVVGTPGRVIDLMKRGTLNLDEVQFVVIDEADQMLAVGFVDDVETIFQRVPKKRQTMLFSATMPTWIKNLVRNYLRNPLTIDLVGDSDQKLADGISLYSIAADMYGKASILAPLITEHAKGGKCIIFTQTKRDADRLAGALSRTLKCEALHGDITQPQRERTLSGFRSGYFNTLVATDVAARGLDVPNVDLVIHYEIPNSSETFVHRSGRTGRAGKKGTAILIYTQDQSRQVKIFERDVGCKFNELPRIAAQDSNMDLSNFMDSGSRYNSFGGSRGGGGNRFAGSGRSSGYGGSGGGGFSSPRSYGQDRFGSNSNRSGDFGASRGSGNFGAPRGSGGSESLSTFGDFVSGRSGDNLRQNNFFGDFGKDHRTRRFSTATSQNDGFSQ